MSRETSPLDFFRVQKRIFTISNLFDFKPSSKWMKILHNVVSFVLKALFLYTGVFFQYFALSLSTSVQQTIMILYVSFACMKDQCKGTVAIWMKRKIVQLWQQLDDDDFRVKNNNEFKYLETSCSYMKIVYIYELYGISNLVVFTMMPSLMKGKQLPTLMWLPFDPHKTTLSYSLAYIGEAMCINFIGCNNLIINMYVMLVLICLNFYYGLLGERSKHIGHKSNSNGSISKSKADIYREMIDLIKCHHKINGYA